MEISEIQEIFSDNEEGKTMKNTMGMGVVLAMLLTALPVQAESGGALAFLIKDRNVQYAEVQGFEAWRLELHDRKGVPALEIIRDHSRVIVPWSDIQGLRRVAVGRWQVTLVSGESFVGKIERNTRLHFGGWHYTADRWARYYIPLEKVSSMWRVETACGVPAPLPREDGVFAVYKATVHLENGDSLSGGMLTESFTIKTAYAELVLSRDDIAAITFAEEEGDTESVLMVNGDRLSGVLMPASFTLMLGGGQQVDLTKEQTREIRF